MGSKVIKVKVIRVKVIKEKVIKVKVIKVKVLKVKVIKVFRMSLELTFQHLLPHLIADLINLTQKRF